MCLVERVGQRGISIHPACDGEGGQAMQVIDFVQRRGIEGLLTCRTERAPTRDISAVESAHLGCCVQITYVTHHSGPACSVICSHKDMRDTLRDALLDVQYAQRGKGLACLHMSCA